MQDGKTALHIAASCGHVKAVEILIEAHIPVNVTDKVLNMYCSFVYHDCCYSHGKI